MDGSKRLRQVLQRPDTVVFAGAGVSVWSDLPAWPALIGELADFLDDLDLPSRLVRRELARADLLQAASYGFDQLGPQERARFLHLACRRDTAKPSLLHRRLTTLGPRCFITTNYDKLLEQALAIERPEAYFQLVSNTNLIETASIIQTRSRDFVFKPHGDIDTADSVILTREQYRSLHGPKRHVYHAFKTLLVSRPVVFVGFGLRDPDFLLIKDTLATIYQGAAQEHYALVPDVDDQELAYWRQNYGIHLVSYATRDAVEPQERHRGLLELLDTIDRPDAIAPAAPPPSEDAETTLSVLRHAKRMQQLAPAPDGEPIPLLVTHRPPRSSDRPMLSIFRHSEDATDALSRPRGTRLLTGPPGAGKTFAVRTVLTRMADQVLEATLGADGLAEDIPIPTYLDLKSYAGDLWSMCAESFPIDFPVEDFVSAGRIAFFLDGLNEVPAQALESNAFRSDLSAFLKRISQCSAVLVTRFGEEHTELDLPELELDAIPEDHVVAHLAELGLSAQEPSHEMLELLRRPFYFRFFQRHALPAGTSTPHAVYAAVLDQLSARCSAHFGATLDIRSVFARLAYERVGAGSQLIPMAAVVNELAGTYEDLDATAVLDWLVSEGVLVPGAKRRVSFFHHSVTEHLAAYHLAQLYGLQPGALRACLRSRHWDHAVLLTLGFLDEDEREGFFNEVLSTDPALGLRALAFLETELERWTGVALRSIAEGDFGYEEQSEIIRPLAGISIAEVHEAQLLARAQTGDRLGGVLLAKTLDLGGRRRVRRAIDLTIRDAADFQFTECVAAALAAHVDEQDVAYAFEQLAALEGENAVRMIVLEEFSAMLTHVDLSALRSIVGDIGQAAPGVQTVLLRRIRDESSRASIDMTVELLPVAAEEALYTLYFQLKYEHPEPEDVAGVDPDMVGPLLLDVSPHRTQVSIDVLERLGTLSPRWGRWIRAAAEREPDGIMAALLSYAGSSHDAFFEIVASLADDEAVWKDERVSGFGACTTLDWNGHEDLLLKLLQLGEDDLASALLESLAMRLAAYSEFNRLDYRLGDVEQWVDRLASVPGKPPFILKDHLGHFIAAARSEDERRQVLHLFENGTTIQRQALTDHVLVRLTDLRLEDISPSAVSWLLSDLRARPLEEIRYSTLAVLATEQFVEDTILPMLLDTTDEPLRSNLIRVARHAGERHGRRYVPADGHPLA